MMRWVPDAPPLTSDELDEWRRSGINRMEAQHWYHGRCALLGPPNREAWGYRVFDTPSRDALGWALTWLGVFGANTYADAAPWVAAFIGVFADAQVARSYRDAGWGAPGDAVRSIKAAGTFARAKVKVDEADRWLAAGFTTERAAKHIAAHVTIKEATEQSFDDATLDVLAGLQTRD